MQWFYIFGIGLNAIGFQWFIRMQGPLDHTPTLNGIRNASVIGGIIYVLAGFFVFHWWVPIVGLFVAPVFIGLILGTSPLAAFPQMAIAIGLITSLVALLAT